MVTAYLIEKAAKRGGFDPGQIRTRHEQLLLRRAVVADVSEGGLLPPGPARMGAEPK